MWDGMDLFYIVLVASTCWSKLGMRCMYRGNVVILSIYACPLLTDEITILEGVILSGRIRLVVGSFFLCLMIMMYVSKDNCG